MGFFVLATRLQLLQLFATPKTLLDPIKTVLATKLVAKLHKIKL
jgi:hypothetical protein